MKKNTKKKLSSEELAAFCAQIASVLKAGISPGEGIAIMLEDTLFFAGTGDPYRHTGNAECYRSFQSWP